MDDTVRVYTTIVDDVINSLEMKWKKSGGHQSTLEEIRKLWMHYALKTCNIETPEPQLSLQYRTRRNRKQAEETAPDLRAFLGSLLGQEKEDYDSDMEYGSELDSESDGKESEESDFFGSDLDTPDITNMVNVAPAKDILTCHYETAERKKSKKCVMEKLQLCRCHFEINGVPRVIKGGSVAMKNNSIP